MATQRAVPQHRRHTLLQAQQEVAWQFLKRARTTLHWPRLHPEALFATIAPVLPDTQLTPRQIFRLFDNGSLSREQLREALKSHALELIDEMEDVHQNPSASWLETMVNKHHAARLIRLHGEPVVREIMLALSEVSGFAPGRWLWNADHADVPLHCFLRTRRAPLFRVLRITSAPFVLTALIEHSDSRRENLRREQFTLERDRFGTLNVTGRTPA